MADTNYNKLVEVEQLYDNDGKQIYPKMVFDINYAPISQTRISPDDDSNQSYVYGVPRFYAGDNNLLNLKTFNFSDIKSVKDQIKCYNGEQSAYQLAIFSDTNGDLYSFIPMGTYATESYVNAKIQDLSDLGGLDINIDNIASLTIFAYINYEGDIPPEKPIGGSWERINGEIVINYPDKWDALENVTGNSIYMSSCLQLIGGKIIENWSTPIKVSGDAGKDGESTEYIYARTKSDSIKPAYKDDSTGEIIIPTDKSELENLVGTNGQIWFDHPQGITEEWPVEWIMYRTKNTMGNWSSWLPSNGPIIWSRYGIKGTDGDGVEYIYFKNNGDLSEIENPTPLKLDSETNEYIYDLDGNYQNDEWLPSGTNWTNEPSGVDASNKVEWVSQRKKKNSRWNAFSDPKIWATFSVDGNDGLSGISSRTLYREFSKDSKISDIKSAVDKIREEINPSGWSQTILDSVDLDNNNVYSIQTYVNSKNEFVEYMNYTTDESGTQVETELYGWQGPYLYICKGPQGSIPDYKTYIYYKSDTKPAKPSITNISEALPDGWEDYPSSDGQWWQCIGSVIGATLAVTWGEVIPVNGVDGVAKDGKYTEFRFTSSTDYPILDSSVDRYPTTNSALWDITPPNKGDEEFIYMISAIISPSTDSTDGILNGTWSNPVKISGENGKDGEDGKDGSQGPIGEPGLPGVSGLPGTEFVIKYCLGRIDINKEDNDDGEVVYEDSVLNVADVSGYIDDGTYDTSGWVNSVSELNIYDADVADKWPYIYCVQGKVSYTRSEDSNTEDDFIKVVDWGIPFKLTGTMGKNGNDGKGGQIIYPAGIYDVDTRYVCDDYKAPYVYYSDNYYILNYNDQNGWLGSEHSNTTPVDASNYWTKIENYEAIFAKVGIIANGLIGSAVFNGNYMFSQQGIDIDGNSVTNYEDFNNSDPYNSSNTFRPNICFDFVDGEAWLAAGNIHLYGKNSENYIGQIGSWNITTDGQLYYKDLNNNTISLDPELGIIMKSNDTITNKIDMNGSGSLANGNIHWDSSGNLYLPPKGILTGTFSGGSIIKDKFDYQFSVYNGGNLLDGTAKVKLITSSDSNGTEINSVLYEEKTVNLPITILGTTETNIVNNNYILLYIDDAIGARIDLLNNSYEDPSYNTFTFEDNTSNGGPYFESFNANKFEFAGWSVKWIGEEGIAKILFYNSDTTSSHTFSITLNNCTANKFSSGDTFILNADEEFYINVKVNPGTSSLIIDEIN